MASNLRSKEIKGFITDSAGNVVSDSNVTVKAVTPTGTVDVHTTTSGDNGEFNSSPLPNGDYLIYSSGVLTAMHSNMLSAGSIPCYYAKETNIPGVTKGNFDTLISGNSADINDFRIFLQIEGEDSDIATYGSSYPVYEVSEYSPVQLDSLFPGMYSALSFNSATRITTTRYDIEYYMPITRDSRIYKRIRWSGVPAIRYRGDLKLVIALDYYSIVADLPKYSDSGNTLEYRVDTNTVVLDGVFDYRSVVRGDVVKVTLDDESLWYGICTDISSTSITLVEWAKKEDTNADMLGVTTYSSVDIYDGMFKGIDGIVNDVNERFTATENSYAQNIEGELFNYPNN